MGWNPSPEVRVARDAAKALNAEVGAVVIYLSHDTLGFASYGHNKALCTKMSQLGEHLYAATLAYYADRPLLP